MKEIKAKGVKDAAGYVETWYYTGRWEGIRLKNEKKIDYIDFIGKIQGISLGSRGFYGPAAEEKMFELSSYLFKGAIITLGNKRKLEGKVKLDPCIPSRIVHVLANEKSRVAEIAWMFNLPMKRNAVSGD